MKIIAETTTKDRPYNSKFLVEMEGREIARLLGFYYTSADECPKLEIGLELNINPVYEGIYNLSYKMIPNKGFDSMAADLRRMAEHLDNLKVNLKEAGELVKDIK